MRLLRCDDLQLHEFFDDEIPQYAILSHTWERSQEVTFQEMQLLNKSKAGRTVPDVDLNEITTRSGYDKISQCAKLASTHGLKWVWIDTCCIDKTSSAELSEAINSMYTWYRKSCVCYAYLSDVPQSREHAALSTELWGQFCGSRWFTRGWTLQELLAPKFLHFYNREWSYFGSKNGSEWRSLGSTAFIERGDLSTALSAITGIAATVLSGGSIEAASVAQRMSWASRRKTSRREDSAYCLLGLFGINMPLLYGEGAKAFLRLQQEIIKVSDDQTIFAWSNDIEQNLWKCYSGFLAPHVGAFRTCAEIVRSRDQRTRRPYSITNTGLRIDLHLQRNSSRGTVVCILDCCYESEPNQPLGLWVTEAWTFNHEHFICGKTQPGDFSGSTELHGVYRDNSVKSPVNIHTKGLLTGRTALNVGAQYTVSIPDYRLSGSQRTKWIYLRQTTTRKHCMSAFGDNCDPDLPLWSTRTAHNIGAFLLYSTDSITLVILRYTSGIAIPLAPCVIDISTKTDILSHHRSRRLSQDVIISMLYLCLKEGKLSTTSRYVNCVMAQRAYGEILVADFGEVLDRSLWGDMPVVDYKKLLKSPKWREENFEGLRQAKSYLPSNICLRIRCRTDEEIDALFPKLPTKEEFNLINACRS